MSRSIFTTFPKELTEEEEILLKKYAKLRKRKNALAAARAQKQETKEVENTTAKRSAEADAADNTQLAKKLLQSGAIKLPTEKKEPLKFKGRPKDIDKPDKPATVGFRPFSVSDEADVVTKPVPRQRQNYKSNIKFVKAHDEDRPEGERGNVAKGNTIFVSGHGDLNEELLRKAFSNFGHIVHVSMDKRNTGFVTFDKTTAADRAIGEMNGSLVDGVQLVVSLSYRQTYVENTIDDSADSAAAWKSIASNPKPTNSNREPENRDVVEYDEDIDYND